VKTYFRYLWYLVVFLLTLELCVRAESSLRWGAPFWGPYSFEGMMVDDGFGGRNRPFARFEKWVINGQGFQGPELRIPKPEGVVRIGVAGASEIFGLYESPGCDLTSQVRKQLERSAPGRFEVVNLATPGMSIPRIIELYERWMRKFEFDAIVYYPSPAMYLDGQAPALRKTIPGRTVNDTGSTRHALDLRLPRKTWEMLRERLPVRLQVEMKRYQIARKRRNHPENWVWERHTPPERVRLFHDHLQELITTFQGDGTRTMIATHANRFRNVSTDMNDPYMVGWIRFYPRASGGSLLDMEEKANMIIRELAGHFPVTVVDVEKEVGKDHAHYADFVHFTDSGANLAAGAIAETILSLYPYTRSH
jgi:hypothetical protein